MSLMTVSPSRLIRAIPMQIAEDLTRLWGYTPPIPLASLARDLDTVVVEEHLGRRGLLGYSWSTETGTRIVMVNSDHAEPVARFTLAHELMHRLLHAQQRTAPLSLHLAVLSLTEMEANAGAVALLVPERWIRPRLEDWKRTTGFVEPWGSNTLHRWRNTVGPQWAREARVSLTALGYRLVDLGVVSSEGAKAWREGSPRWGA